MLATMTKMVVESAGAGVGAGTRWKRVRAWPRGVDCVNCCERLVFSPLDIGRGLCQVPSVVHLLTHGDRRRVFNSSMGQTTRESPAWQGGVSHPPHTKCSSC
jgi:hypothetical protein